MDKVILTEQELACQLGLSKWTVRRMRIEEHCPHFNVGSRIFYRLDTIMQWIESREQEKSIPKEAEYGKIRKIM